MDEDNNMTSMKQDNYLKGLKFFFITIWIINDGQKLDILVLILLLAFILGKNQAINKLFNLFDFKIFNLT
jgi:hypothetical protein